MAILLETIKSSSLTARRYSNHNNNSNSNNTKEEEGEEETTTTIITTTFHLQGTHAEVQYLKCLPAQKKMRVIRVEPDVHEALDEIGQRGETYGEIVKRLVKFYKEHSQKK